MNGNNNSYSIAYVEGEATISREKLGTLRAVHGMSFTDVAKITIKTGPSSRVIIITPRGEAMDIGEMSCEVISKHSSQDFIDTLRNIRVTARDMMASRRKMTLQSAVNR